MTGDRIMPDLFQAYDRDTDEPSTHYVVMEKLGSFWYYSGGFPTRDDALEAARRIAGEGNAVVVDEVTTTVVFRMNGEPAARAGRNNL